MERSDWMDLDAIARKIADARSRLERARTTRNHGLTKVLQDEIADAERLRDRILSKTGAQLVGSLSEQPDVPSPQAGSSSSKPVAAAEPSEGVEPVSNELGHADLQRIKRELNKRRSEMLARHAEELKLLDADIAEIDSVEQAVEGVLRKFKMGGAEVLSLERPVLSQAS